MNFSLVRNQMIEDTLQIDVELPAGDRIQATARVIYSSPTEDEYLLGVRLIHFENDDQRKYAAYLKQLESTVVGAG